MHSPVESGVDKEQTVVSCWAGFQALELHDEI